MSPKRTPARASPKHQVSVWLPREAWRELAAGAGVLGKTQAHIVTVALRKYFDALPDETTKAIQQSMALRLKPPR